MRKKMTTRFRGFRPKRLGIERLESRSLLAILGLGAALYEDDGGALGDEITGERLVVGETYWIEVRVQDLADPDVAGDASAGIVSLPLNFYWNPQVLQLAGDSPDADLGPNPGQANIEVPADNPLLNPKFTSALGQRFVDDVDGTGGRIENLRGGTFVAADAVGQGGPEWFSRLRFQAVGAAEDMQFLIELAGTPGFADGDALTGFTEIGSGAIEHDLINNPVVVTAAIDVDALVGGSKFNVGTESDQGLDGWNIRAYGDADGDGLLDQAEFDAGDIASDVTDTAGGYSLTLPVGDYIIVEELPTGWIQTYPATEVLAAGIDTAPLTLGSRGYALSIDTGTGNQEHVDFGNLQDQEPLVEISGYKWEDTDGDGAWDAGEPGLAGWTIYIDTNANGQPDTGEPAAVTGADGQYVLGGLVSGQTYTLREVAQGGWTATYPTGGSHTVTAPLAGALSSATAPNFGNSPPPDEPESATISGYKWEDTDGDGIWDAGETGLAGWTIYIDTNANGQPDAGEPAAVTDADGQYMLGGLVSGQTYTLREVVQGGWTATYPAGGSHTVTAPLAGALSSATAPNFGNSPPPDEPEPATISGYKWEDTDGDGVWDAGETGLAGWTIYIDTNGNGQPDAGEPAAVTDASGRYAFPDLVSGQQYTLREVAQSALPNNTYPAGGSHVVTAPLTGSSGAAEPPNFGNAGSTEAALSNLSGFVYADGDQDGVRDTGGLFEEIGLPNVELALYRQEQAGGYAFVATTTTDPDGWYSFDGLQPGTYRIVEQQPAGFLSTKTTRGTLVPPAGSTLPPEANPGVAGVDVISGITLTEGVDGIEYNFGEIYSARSINKRMFLVSPPPAKEMAAQRLGLTARTVRGTAGDDVIEFTPQGDEVVVTVNGAARRFANDEVDLVTIDAGGGNDTVILAGARTGDVARQSPGRSTLRSSDRYSSFDYAVETVTAETVRVRRTNTAPAGGLAVLFDSPGDDALEVGGNEAALTRAPSGLVDQALAYAQVRAYGSAGGNNTIDRQAATDYLFTLMGDWTEV